MPKLRSIAFFPTSFRLWLILAKPRFFPPGYLTGYSGFLPSAPAMSPTSLQQRFPPGHLLGTSDPTSCPSCTLSCADPSLCPSGTPSPPYSSVSFWVTCWVPLIPLHTQAAIHHLSLRHCKSFKLPISFTVAFFLLGSITGYLRSLFVPKLQSINPFSCPSCNPSPFPYKHHTTPLPTSNYS